MGNIIFPTYENNIGLTKAAKWLERYLSSKKVEYDKNLIFITTDFYHFLSYFNSSDQNSYIYYPYVEYKEQLQEKSRILLNSLSDIILLPTKFIYDIYLEHGYKNIFYLRQPIYFESYNTKASKILEEYCSKKFVISYIFDIPNNILRKNPEGVIEAYKKAFKNKSDTCLIIKTRSFGKDIFIDYINYLKDIAKDSNIVILDEDLSDEEVFNLIANSNVYISLHRAEGLGLTLLNAAIAGTPILAPYYGGFTDFIDKDYILSVNYELKTFDLNINYSIENGKATMAEPDIDHAVYLLKDIYENYKKYKDRSKIYIDKLIDNISLEKTDFYWEKISKEILSSDIKPRKKLVIKERFLKKPVVLYGAGLHTKLFLKFLSSIKDERMSYFKEKIIIVDDFPDKSFEEIKKLDKVVFSPKKIHELESPIIALTSGMHLVKQKMANNIKNLLKDKKYEIIDLEDLFDIKV